MSICSHTIVEVLPQRPYFPSGVRNYDFDPVDYERFKGFFVTSVLPSLELPATFDHTLVKLDYNFMWLGCLQVMPEAAFSKEEMDALSVSKMYEKKTVTYLGLSGKAIFFLIACAVALASGGAYYNGVKPVDSLTLEQATTLVIISSVILTYLNSYAGLWITGILPDTVSKYENKEQNAIDEILLKKSKSVARVMLDWYSPRSSAPQKALAVFFANKIDFNRVFKKLAPHSTQADKILTTLDPLKEVCKLIQMAEEGKAPFNKTDWMVIAERMGIVFPEEAAEDAV